MLRVDQLKDSIGQLTTPLTLLAPRRRGDRVAHRGSYSGFFTFTQLNGAALVAARAFGLVAHA